MTFFIILHIKFGIVTESLEACKGALLENLKKRVSVPESHSQFRKHDKHAKETNSN